MNIRNVLVCVWKMWGMVNKAPNSVRKWPWQLLGQIRKSILYPLWRECFFFLLSHLQVFAPTAIYAADGQTIVYAYAGLAGNIWKFDLTSTNSGSWSAKDLPCRKNRWQTATHHRWHRLGH